MYETLLKYGYPNGWPDKVQHENFLNLLTALKFRNKEINQLSVLDVGCGTGDLYYVLKLLGCKNYTGIDNFAPSLRIARSRYPDGNFIEKSALHNTNYYDYIFASGLISNMDKMSAQLTLHFLWQYCKTAFSFNFISEPTEYLAWYDVDEMTDYCEQFCNTMSLISCGNQTTIILQK